MTKENHADDANANGSLDAVMLRTSFEGLSTLTTSEYAVIATNAAAMAHESGNVDDMRRSLRELAFLSGLLFSEKNAMLRALSDDTLIPSVASFPDDSYQTVLREVQNGKDAAARVMLTSGIAARDAYFDLATKILNKTVTSVGSPLPDTFFQNTVKRLLSGAPLDTKSH